MERLPIHISTSDGLPIYRQIVNQISHLVAAGKLKPDEEITPIRVLAEELLINPNTVARAYRELENAGILTKRRGAGTYVGKQVSPLQLRIRQQLLRAKSRSLIVEARQLGFTLDEVVADVREADADLTPEG